MKIAVTAASGSLGSAIISELKSHISPENVIGVARTPAKAKHLGVEIRKGDYNSKQEFVTALQGIDAVLLVSGMDAPDKRIGQHQNVIEAAKQSGLQKIVYTSIIGDPEKTAFSPIIKSNRQTEEDVKNSGLDWAIGRNGLYLEPDMEYIDSYMQEGEIVNCAGEGLCGYTSRGELAVAYTSILLNDKHNGHVYNLLGEPITQEQLAVCMNDVFGINLKFRNISVKDYIAARKAELGEFLGTIIGGIYEGIKNGAFAGPSDFEKAAGRSHKKIQELMTEFKATL
jgi:NAD(P)H dehydrogenase (quinone)